MNEIQNLIQDFEDFEQNSDRTNQEISNDIYFC